MITKNKTKDVFLTKKQLQTRITANTLEEGVIYHTTDEPAGHSLKYENGVLSLLDADGTTISSQNIQAASAGFGTPTVDNTNANQVGTANVEVTASGPDTAKIFNFKFSNLKGATGAKGDNGTTPTISASATVDANTGTPSVTVTKSGTDTTPSFKFDFKNLKGEKGDNGTDAEVTSQKIFDLTEDSETVVREIDSDTGKVQFHLDTASATKLNNALQMPTTAPSDTKIVAIGTNKAQTNISVGDGLKIENGVLKAESTGGTNVEANPDDPATLALETLKIGTITYKIPVITTTENEDGTIDVTIE